MLELFNNFDRFFEDTVRIPNNPAWIILCGYNIGETIQFCSLAGEFKKHHGNEIILIITPKHKHIADMYAHQFIKIVMITDDNMKAILRSGYIPQDRFELNQPLSACWIDRGFRYSDGIRFLGRYPGRGGISEIDCVRFILHLPWNSKLEPPKISPETEKRVIDFAVQSGGVLGRSVLLCPINNSATKLPLIFWQKLAEEYTQKGFKVFTNMGGLNNFNGLAEMPIAGTIPVNLTIEEIVPFCRFAGNVVIGNNGMSMLLMMNRQKNFKITQLISHSLNAPIGHSSLGFQSPTHTEKGNYIVASYQYCAPELCIDSDFSEYFIPFDGEENQLIKLAHTVAVDDRSDESYIKRPGHKSDCFVTEHIDWLLPLIEN